MLDSTEYALFGAIDLLEGALNDLLLNGYTSEERLRHAKDQIHAAIMEERLSENSRHG